MRTLSLYAVRSFMSLACSFAATCVSVAFLAVTSFLFAHGLAGADGTIASVPVLWATAATITLPCLAAFATMRLIADDRQSGRLDLVLCAPISERDYVLGRFVGAFVYVMLVLAIYLFVPLAILPRFATAQSVTALR